MSKVIFLFLFLAISDPGVLPASPSGCLDRGSHSMLRPFPPASYEKERSVLRSDAYLIALRYLKSHWKEFNNRKYLTIVDYTKRSTSRRLYLIELESGRVGRFFVSHGKNSGWTHARRFSNKAGSLRSSKGFFRTGSIYNGKVGPCLELHGLEKGVNDKALERKLVMHGAQYAQGWSIVLNRGRLGRSLGCLALPDHEAPGVMNKVKNGSLLYVHAK